MFHRLIKGDESMKIDKQKRKRPEKHDHYFNRARVVAEMSTCLRRKVGVIVINDGVEICSGYVGSPRKTNNCIDDETCLRAELEIPSGERYELCRSVHAEQNAIINAARVGVSIIESEMYIYSDKMRIMYNKRDEINTIYGPCMICKKQIINAGLSKVHMKEEGVGTKSFTLKQIKEILNQEEKEIKKFS